MSSSRAAPARAPRSASSCRAPTHSDLLRSPAATARPVLMGCSDERQHHRPAAKRRLKHSTSSIDDEFDLVVLARLELRSVLDETSNGELRTAVVNSCDIHNAAQSGQTNVAWRTWMPGQYAAGHEACTCGKVERALDNVSGIAWQ